MYQIGELSDKADVSTQTIRYYERAGVLPEPERARNDYRLYDQDDVERLRFVRSLRLLGLSLDEIRGFMALRERRIPATKAMLDLISEKLARIESQISELQDLREEISSLRGAFRETGQGSTDEDQHSQ